MRDEVSDGSAGTRASRAGVCSPALERGVVAEGSAAVGVAAAQAGQVADVIRRARGLDRSSAIRDRTIDITTKGARTGQFRRIEIWLWSVDGRLYLASDETPRSWFANVKAHPCLILHFKNDGAVDVPAAAIIVRDRSTRRTVLAEILAQSNRDPALLDLWVDRSPLVELIPEGS